ncbi:CAP-D2 condensin subunit [Leptinotarsa decemlineata]|uniref:CAP-D2 condensin subunit n=1 Tax=Leptinotarsa decemlineata TaxID=7539 RepID=UPI003D30D74A
MAHFNFVIPGNKADLLKSSVRGEYWVQNVLIQKEIPTVLKNSRALLREERGEFILGTFDTYYSVIHHGDTIALDIAYKAYEDLHKGISELLQDIDFKLEDKESLNDEIKLKTANILKMYLYIYTQIVLLIEQRNAAKNEQLLKGRKKSSKSTDDDFTIDKKSVLLNLNSIIQREISMFWESQAVEEALVNVVSGICYEFLQNPSIKREKEEFAEIFNVLGHLLKAYNHGMTFVVRITQLVKLHEHLVQCLPKGMQQLVQSFNYKSLLHELVEELTEWQTDDRHQDSQGARHCATVLSSLAALMPDLMMPEVVQLNSYLFHDPPSLRMSVIMVMVEVILNNLTSHILESEQKQFRDDLFGILIEHIDDNSALVRAKVFQQCARLQNESAIPLKFQRQILEKVVEHLYDKGAIARKSAANCVTTFLSFNLFSANLSLSKMKVELERNKELLKTVKEQFKDPKVEKLMELQAQWDKKVNTLKDVVTSELEKGKENEDYDNQDKENQIPTDEIPELIRIYLQEDKFKEAFQVCRGAVKDSKFLEKFKELQPSDDIDSSLYMTILYTTFFDITKVMEQMENSEFMNISKEDYKKVEALVKQVEFFEDCVAFLNLIDKAIDTMIELLDTTSTSDMHEAIGFFIAAYKFDIDRANDGILAMLKQMQRNEQERKDAVTEAFRTIYLVSEASNMAEHCTIIVHRLINLVKTVPVHYVDDLEEIIANWCKQGTLDNAVIDMLWQFVTQRVSVDEETQSAAFELLRMAALGRKTIISRNLNLVMNIATGERARKNMALLGICCNLLSVAFEKVDINGKTPPFKIKSDDAFFKELVDILSEQFFKPVEFYYKALYGGIDFIYKMCSEPETVCEALFSSIIPKLARQQKDPDATIPEWAMIRLCQMTGYVAIKHLVYLDDTTYKELKRRQNIRDERKKVKTVIRGKKNNKETNIRKSLTAATASEASSMMTSVAIDESTLDGAQAEDIDAEFILNVLENDTVTGSGFLAKLVPFVTHICSRPDIYKTQEIQFAALTSLMRLMLVSSKFCENHIRLIFTIFEKTPYPEIKANVLIHVSDLLSRFPNVIEPWTPRIFQSLKDPLPQTRKATFFSLSNLILRDMIRAHSHIPEMASCLADEDPGMRSMAKTFFAKLAHKENNLYNALPDIFTHVMGQESVDDEGVKNTMSLLFDLVENSKHMEPIVSRFCGKFKITEDIRHHRNISYCLTLIKYNDKALKKLIDEFITYKHLLHDSDVYANFKTIMNICNKGQVGKADLKPIVTELENLIKSVFELNENGMMPPPPPKSAKKRSKPKKKTSSRRKRRSESDSDDSD